MISREELIKSPKFWVSTDKLNLDVFDHINKKFGGSYYLKRKKGDHVFFGHYHPESKSFICYTLNDSKKITIKREEISDFIALPPIDFDIKNRVVS